MRIQRAWINNYVAGLDKVTKSNVDVLMRALSRLDTSSPTLLGDVQAIMQMLCQYSAKQAAVLAAGMYDVIHEAELGYAYGAEAVSSYVPKATAIATNAIMREGLTDRARSGLAQRIGYEVKRSAGECVKYNAWHEAREVPAYGRKRIKPRYARVPGMSTSYVDGCPFCKLLASRGFVYHTAESAGEDDHYHPDCQCMVIPSFAETDIAGYDPNRYYDEWMNREARIVQKEAERTGRDATEIAQERNDHREAQADKAKKARKQGMERGNAPR